MGKTYRRLKGSQNLRQRLVLATLSSTPILIENIRTDDTFSGLKEYEVSFLRLLEKICNDCYIEIPSATTLKYKPGIVIGGSHLYHDCGVSRSIGYFLEPLLVLALFAKKPLTIRLKGITNDSKDPSVDTFRSTTLPILKLFGVPCEGLDLIIESRGVPPNGGGEVVLAVPIVHSLNAVSWTDEGLIKRIRGVTFSARVSSQFENIMIHAARGILNLLLSDVHIFTDHRVGPQAGKSPGYGISLVGETTCGVFISVDTTICHARAGEICDFTDDNKTDLVPPEDVGRQIAFVLLEEIKLSGVVDSTHQGLLFLLCALCRQDVSKIRVGKLSQHGIQTLREIRDFLDLKFIMKTDPRTETIILKCIGSGMKNLSRKHS
ncbi:probable RNA 3'-terminal phosphate cyclase-like protein isoform X2 [Prosopis cineraria]|uniref:probable RNA 3'-terminal phosphate cyclase-like protein isoform X2 n=1 Tax=Prosopis cineraria TaxID=364024 RepID=UPI00240FC8D1|nr:probable RNA 3'-terminal phosphate cyclase-like protein isoform X2 [Prosopis cineraria]